MVTTPFADDFNLLTREKGIHQILLSDIEEKIKSMGFILKPTKCRYLSIEKGKVENIKFKLMNYETDSVIDRLIKFIGSVVGAVNTPSAMFVEIMSKLKTKLENISKSTLRGEFKLNIYTRYA